MVGVGRVEREGDLDTPGATGRLGARESGPIGESDEFLVDALALFRAMSWARPSELCR